MRMSRAVTILLIVWVGAAALLGAGCRKHGASPGESLVRLIDADSDAQEVAVSVDGKQTWKGAKFGSGTGFAGVPPGDYQVQAVSDEGYSGLDYITCRPNVAYTVLILGGGPSAPPRMRIFADPPISSDEPNRVRLRFIDAAEGLEAADMLLNNVVAFAGEPYGSRSDELQVDAGDYDIKVNAAGRVQSLIGPIPLRCQPGRAYTIVASGPRTNVSVNVYDDSR